MLSSFFSDTRKTLHLFALFHDVKFPKLQPHLFLFHLVILFSSINCFNLLTPNTKMFLLSPCYNCLKNSDSNPPNCKKNWNVFFLKHSPFQGKIISFRPIADSTKCSSEFFFIMSMNHKHQIYTWLPHFRILMLLSFSQIPAQNRAKHLFENANTAFELNRKGSATPIFTGSWWLWLFLMFQDHNSKSNPRPHSPSSRFSAKPSSHPKFLSCFRTTPA